ncbi:MAG: glycosyltransferase, partial [Deltaproteobacteria bacterium]|nr:glycosyltransferase [Deltaproteobacteria bacterium]
FRIGCAGIFKYAKGLPYLFKAVSQLSADGGINLELVGTVRDSEREMFDETLERTGIRDIVELKEPIAHEAVPAWLRTLDLFVLPSVTEGCPNILMEAMASGVPIVATRTGAVEDLVLDRVSGLLVPWGDSLALARAIYEVMEDGSLALSLGSAARARMADFSPQVERTAWETVYSELIEF